MEAFILAITPFVLNGIMTFFKWLGAQDMSTPGKRLLLALFSIIGVLAGASLTGATPDMQTLSGLLQTALMALVAFLAAHGSYVLFWKKN